MSATATKTKAEPKGEAKTKGEAVEAKPKTTTAMIGEELTLLDAAVKARSAAVEAVGFIRVRLGHLFNTRLAELAKDGVTGEAAQGRIMGLIGTTRLDDKGEPYTWSSVEPWMRGAAVEAKLSEANRGRFAVDGLTKIGQVVGKATAKAKAEGKTVEAGFGEAEADSFASKLVKAGTTGNRAVRAAYGKDYPASKREPKSDLALAEAMSKDEALLDASKPVVTLLVKAGIAPHLIAHAVRFAVEVGHKAKTADAGQLAVEQLLVKPVQAGIKAKADKAKADAAKATA